MNNKRITVKQLDALKAKAETSEQWAEYFRLLAQFLTAPRKE